MISFQNTKKATVLLCFAGSLFTFDLFISSLLTSIRANAHINTCDVGSPEAPATDSRTYRNDEGKFSFSIPANYRAMGVENGALILNPQTFQYVRCIIDSNLRTEFPLEDIAVSVTPIDASKNSLYDLVIQVSPWMETEGFNFQSIDFQGYDAIAYSQQNMLHDRTLSYISLLSRDRRTLITISGPQGGEELEKALSTFRFES